MEEALWYSGSMLTHYQAIAQKFYRKKEKRPDLRPVSSWST
jgi:hypothetical protein